MLGGKKIQVFGVAQDEKSLKDYAAKQEPKEKSQAEIDAEDAEAKAKSEKIKKQRKEELC